jgi:hypothetical protein
MGTMNDLLRIPAEEIGTRPKMIAWCVAAAFTMSAPAYAGTFDLIASSYSLGSAEGGVGPGASSATNGTTAGPLPAIGIFGTPGGGFDHLLFTGAGSNSIGIHTYGSEDGTTTFGSRSSGLGTFFVDGVVRYSTTIRSDSDPTFSFALDGGEVSAVGSAGFGASDFQFATMYIRIQDDYSYTHDTGTGSGSATLIDYALRIRVGAGGAVSTAGTIQDPALTAIGALGLGFGAGFGSFFYNGGSQTLSLLNAAQIAAGANVTGVTGVTHNIFYELGTIAAGNLTTAASCLGAQSNFPGLELAAAVVGGGEGGYGDPSFPAICGAGARTGDPLNPEIRVPVSNVPVPGSESLVGLGLAALALARLRQRKKSKHA